MSPTIYLDSNATTSVHPAAIAAAVRVMEVEFGNPSSTHTQGVRAKVLVDEARELAAQLIGAGEGSVVFNSGATEGIQTAALSALCDIRARRDKGEPTGNLLVYGATEHKAVPQSLAHWNALLGLNLELRVLPVHADGLHNLQTLAQWLPDTAMLCTMTANNETGVVSDIAAIEKLLRAADAAAPHRTLWLVDCVQALGKLALNLANSRVDYAPFSGHKLYAPKGIGMLYVRHGAPFTALMAGGGQEGGMRSGTENMAGIAAFGAVLKECLQGSSFADHATLLQYRNALEGALRSAFPDVQFNAPLSQCLPTTLNFSVPGINSKILIDVLDAAGVCVSAGSACSAAKAMPSYVLDAMGLPEWRTTSAIRMSFGPLVTAATIEAACVAIARCAQALYASDKEQVSTQPVSAGQSASEPVAVLQWSELESFIAAHPEATLVDVREAAEHQVSNGIHCGGIAAVNAPLSALSGGASPWLVRHTAPVVFVCRSGNRSLKAAQWLQSQGHTQVRHIHGGLALRPL
jgi:cysteine sulfinate desulfinase/cysteine desulfurase-like protein/rhodanese-related sulfurtransferase